MPGFDAAGPRGQGAMTGRRQGRCEPKSQEVPRNESVRRGNRGRGGGRSCGGFRRNRWGLGVRCQQGIVAPFINPMSDPSASDLEALKSDVQALNLTIERISARIASLELELSATEATA